MTSSKYLVRRLLLFLLACVVFLQYLHLLQPSARAPGLFVLRWVSPGSQRPPPLLRPPRPVQEEDDLVANVTTAVKGDIPPCPMIPAGLLGPVKAAVGGDVPATMSEVESRFSHLSPGGKFAPEHCVARHKVALLVPYRDREDHLRTFLFNIHAFLKRQLVDYGVFIVEQQGDGRFNRAMLMNVGAAEALKQDNYTVS